MKKALIILLFTTVHFGLIAQTQAELKAKMEKTKKEISLTTKMIEETEKDKTQSFNKLILIQNKIELRERYLKELSLEIQLIERKVQKASHNIKSLELQLNQLKSEYAKMIYYAYKNRNSYEKLMFLLSSENFNQAYKRMLYIQQYSDFRKNQVEKIIQKQDSLKYAVLKYKKLVSLKKSKLDEVKTETNLLSKEKSQEAELLKILEGKKKELLEDLKKKELMANKLKKEIQKLIEAEKKERMKENKFGLTPEEKIISAKFGENMGRLPWPTERGVIISSFGEHPHPILKNITINNDGIDISAPKGAKVRALFDGVVSKVIVIPGSNSAILVRHGNYLTVYSNVVDVKVKNGQKINSKQELGTIYTDTDSGRTVLQLQIWRETTKLNPQLWLAK